MLVTGAVNGGRTNLSFLDPDLFVKLMRFVLEMGQHSLKTRGWFIKKNGNVLSRVDPPSASGNSCPCA